MRLRIASLATTALVLGMTPLPGWAQQTITCSSDDEGRHNCPVDTRGGVQMTNQRSGAACTQGYSWDTTALASGKTTDAARTSL
jgi:Protein of unknown function (DUF3011)